MTKQEYSRYTGTAYMSRYRNPKDAMRLALNKYNLCKTKIIILDDGTYGVCQNSLAKKFFQAGYKEYHIGFAEIAAL